MTLGTYELNKTYEIDSIFKLYNIHGFYRNINKLLNITNLNMINKIYNNRWGCVCRDP